MSAQASVSRIGFRFIAEACRPQPSSVNWFQSALNQDMSLLAELWQFLRVRKKFWLLPVLVMMLVFGALLVATQSSALAPFIYTLF